MRKAIQVNFMRILSLFVLFALVLTMCAGGNFSTRAYAETGGELNFDKTNVLDDLGSSTIDGKPFNLNDYPRNPYGTAQMITFVEYCYSQYDNGFGNYALYVYVYNPALVDFATASTQNKIEISTDFFYGNEEGQVGDVKDYAKFSLKFCNASSGDYENLFLKFRIVDENNIIQKAQREYEKETGYRYYHISGIELFEVGDSATNAHDYWVNKYYKFSGYAEGYGDSEKFPFQCISTGESEAVQLNVKHTFYRTLTSSKGANYQNQLDTVYFAVPKRLFDTYGELQRIKAEWYEYKTKSLIVTSNNAAYEAIEPYLGRLPDGGDGGTSYYDLAYGLGENVTTGDLMPTADWGWNTKRHITSDICNFLGLMFLVDNIEEYDPYADIVDIGGVESNQLYERIKNYNKSFMNGTLPIKDGSISADLFESDIDDYRKKDTEFGKIQQGYSYYDFDADVDLQKLSSWQETDPSFWDNWKNWGLWDTLFGNIPEEETQTLSPIEILEEGDLDGTPEEVSDRLFVNANDVNALRNYYDDAITVDGKDDEECFVVLFRFATTDYYSAPVTIVDYDATLNSKKYINGQAYRAWESVFFDFDIIQLTFNNDGVYHVIPAVSDPIDIINSITPPVDMGDDWDWLKWLFAILAIIVLFIILMPILPYIIKAVVWIVMLPFKAIAALFKGIKKAAKKKPKQSSTSPPQAQVKPQKANKRKQ